MTEEEARPLAIKSAENDLEKIRQKLNKMQSDLNCEDESLCKKALCEIAYLEHWINAHLERDTAIALLFYNKKKSANEEVKE